MYFTQEDYLKIERWLEQRTVKDTEFPEADELTVKDYVPVIQDNINKILPIQRLVQEIVNTGFKDFYNISEHTGLYNLTLGDAIGYVPKAHRKVGLVITFKDEDKHWNIYQFRGYSTNQWRSLNYWEDIISGTVKRYIDEHIQYADEEDITAVKDGNRTFLKFKDRHPGLDEFVGTGTIILRRNIIGVDECNLDGEGSPRNVLTQEMISEENVIYVVQYDFDLDDKTIAIPKGSTLWFQGGSINNGSMYMNDTPILGAFEFADMGENLKMFGKFNTGQIMTFNDDSYRKKEGDYFMATQRPSSSENNTDTELFYDKNPDAYVIAERQELRWWNGVEWIRILDIVDYNEIMSIIDDLINKVNLEIAAIYSYFKDEIFDIKEDIANIYNLIDQINAEIQNIYNLIRQINQEIDNIKIQITDIYEKLTQIFDEINNIKTEINNIKNEITSIWSKITELSQSITNIWNKIEEIEVKISELKTYIDNRITEIKNYIDESIENITQYIDDSINQVIESQLDIQDFTLPAVKLFPDNPPVDNNLPVPPTPGQPSEPDTLVTLVTPPEPKEPVNFDGIFLYGGAYPDNTTTDPGTTDSDLKYDIKLTMYDENDDIISEDTYNTINPPEGEQLFPDVYLSRDPNGNTQGYIKFEFTSTKPCNLTIVKNTKDLKDNDTPCGTFVPETVLTETEITSYTYTTPKISANDSWENRIMTEYDFKLKSPDYYGN